MKRHLQMRREIWPLAAPFRIAGHLWEDLHTVIATITANGVTGSGEAAGVFYAGETADTILAEIETVKDAIESGASRLDLLDLLPAGGARNALDCAIWDFEAKSSGTSVADLTGRSRQALTTVFTIGIKDEIEDMAAEARSKAGFPVLKLKLDSEVPVERVEAVRSARPDATIIIDANQGFSLDLLRNVLPAFERLDVAMIEQPLPRGQDDALDAFTSPIPLCADESFFDRSDLAYALERYQIFNIKLDKTGGLTEALHISEELARRGRPTMVGNMIGTSLAMAPAFLIGQSCKFVDLDGPLLLAKDRENGMVYHDSQISWPRHLFWG